MAWAAITSSASQAEPNIHPGGIDGALPAAAYQAPFILIGREPSSDPAHDVAPHVFQPTRTTAASHAVVRILFHVV